MKISRITMVVLATLLASACASTPQAGGAGAAEEAPHYSRRAGCPDGYAPVGTRIKRCTAMGADVRTVSGDAARNAIRQSGALSTGHGDPPRD